jgi:glycosyltransferase involved in cell wall biosynthesis
LDITFIITDQQKPHEGVVRPFISFAKGLESKYKLSFYLLNCSSDFVESFQQNNFQITVSGNKNSLIQGLIHLNPRLVVVDDDLKRLELANEIGKEVNAKTVAYVQILYGSHAIANCFDLSSLGLKQKLLFALIKYVPFSFFSNRYAKVLKKFDLVVANSKVTATFLQSLYNVEVDGIIYPAIDTDTFQPSDQKPTREVTLYLGSHLGDSRKQFIEKIVDTAVADGFFVNVFGNAKIASTITNKNDSMVSYHSNLTDKDLAKMYSRSKLTICPQKWEQFGLVPVESMSCGTPVLAFNCMGFQETIGSTTGWLANNEKAFLQLLHGVLESKEIRSEKLRNTVIENFSIGASGKALERLLEKYFNNKT